MRMHGRGRFLGCLYLAPCFVTVVSIVRVNVAIVFLCQPPRDTSWLSGYTREFPCSLPFTVTYFLPLDLIAL
jgi:hypothetical protein